MYRSHSQQGKLGAAHCSEVPRSSIDDGAGFPAPSLKTSVYSLANGARLVGATTWWVRPTPEQPLSPWVIAPSRAPPQADRRGGVGRWILNEQPPTAVPSTHLGVRPK